MLNSFEWIFDKALRGRTTVGNGREQLLVWGTGVYAEMFTRILNALGIVPLAYIDSDKNKQGKIFHNKLIMEPKAALAEFSEADIVLAMKDIYAHDVGEELRAQGRDFLFFQEFVTDQLGNIKILEIGPMHNPLFRGEKVKYFDVFDAETLRSRAAGFGLPVNSVPKYIDFVSPDGNWDNIKEKFDLIFSSHVLEHQTNLVKHLQDVETHVRSGGGICICCA